jgi:hypothetical protein
VNVAKKFRTGIVHVSFDTMTLSSHDYGLKFLGRYNVLRPCFLLIVVERIENLRIAEIQEFICGKKFGKFSEYLLVVFFEGVLIDCCLPKAAF